MAALMRIIRNSKTWWKKALSMLLVVAVVLMVNPAFASYDTARGDSDLVFKTEQANILKQSGYLDGLIEIDTDGDGLPDKLEKLIGTDPNKIDTDGDGLFDYEEFCKYKTNPLIEDSDGDGKIDSDWNERREYTYTIDAICTIKYPYDLDTMNDEFQDVRKIKEKDGVLTYEIVLYPKAIDIENSHSSPINNFPPEFNDYLKKTTLFDYDTEMAKEVNKIIEGSHTDLEVIDKIVSWLHDNTSMPCKAGPLIYRYTISDNKVVDANNWWMADELKSWPRQKILDTFVYGKEMFQNRTHGSCSSMAILFTTMLRSIGIPTRLAKSVMIFNPFDPEQLKLLENIKDKDYRNYFISKAKKYPQGADHTFNEIYVGGKWVRGDGFRGFAPMMYWAPQIKVISFPDYSTVDFAHTWGAIPPPWNKEKCVYNLLSISDQEPIHKINPLPSIKLSAKEIANLGISLDWEHIYDNIYLHNNIYFPYPRVVDTVFRETLEGEPKPIGFQYTSTDFVDINVELNKTYHYYIKTTVNPEFPQWWTPYYSTFLPSNKVVVTYKDEIPPTITILRPNNLEIVNNNFVTISGIATDSQTGIDKVTVNGNVVSVASHGSFSKSVNLTEGTNTITIIATDKTGNKATKTITVIYEKPVQIIVIALQPDNSYMVVNGISQEIDPGRGTKPVIIPEWSRTVVPIRAIVEALGGTISWDPLERKVTINFNDTVINLWIDNPEAKVNGTTVYIDPNNHNVKPIIVNSRTMLPLRFVAESLSCDVGWDNNTRTITITYGG